MADLEGDSKYDQMEEINKEEIHLEAWASVEDSSMTMMDSDLEVEACSSKCNWEEEWVAWVAWAVEGLVPSNRPRFQVEALHSLYRQRRI